REPRGRRGHAAVDQIDGRHPLTERPPDGGEPRIELTRALEVRERREPYVARAHPSALAARRVAGNDRHAQRDLVDIRRERIDVPRERTFDLPERAVGG